jgi:toxin ParE1/3/4
MTVRFTQRAKRDVAEIGNYIARDDPGAAVRLLELIEQKCDLVGRYPELGPLRPDIAPDLRYVAVGNYLIFCRASEGNVIIVRVVHGARKVEWLIR